jgi:hypothetical protein
MMIIKCLCIIFISLLFGNACGQEWLDGGYVGSSGGSDIAQYFTDPIFYSGPIGAQRYAWEQQYYPYFGNEFFRNYAQPYRFKPGIYPGSYGVYPFNPEPYYSDVRLKSLAGLKWEPFQKSNWSEIINYAKTRSSMKVYQNGVWMSP